METQVQPIQSVSIVKQLFTHIYKGEKTNKVQLFFLAEVLATYRESNNYSIIRTDTSGRLKKTGGWSIDFGISGVDDSFIHTSIESFTQRIPNMDHEHWLSYAVSLPVSANFIKGLIRPGCLDDGAIRKW